MANLTANGSTPRRERTSYSGKEQHVDRPTLSSRLGCLSLPQEFSDRKMLALPLVSEKERKKRRSSLDLFSFCFPRVLADCAETHPRIRIP